MLSDLRNGVWSEVRSAKPIDSYRRNIQRAHVIRLGELMNDESMLRSDIQAAARAELKAIQSLAKTRASSYGAGMNRYHLEDIVALVDEIITND